MLNSNMHKTDTELSECLAVVENGVMVHICRHLEPVAQSEPLPKTRKAPRCARRAH